MGVVLDNGVLFRSGAEGKIREAVVKSDLVEGVVALPSNLFTNTGSPGCFIIINKNKSPELNGKIFFIHAENEFQAGKAMNYLLEENIKNIVSTYNEKKIINKFSDLIEMSEVINNDCNLNVSRYIDIYEEEEKIDLSSVLIKIKDIKLKRNEIEFEFIKNMKNLGFD